ncbi:hypothetical protein SDC9_72303 [bioreactor metagenome]|uniref:Uncharacterized protein n=1 Tax=bioreactor metagenome TaxID=1076179 RepID=A0A644YH46_9ZZZZ
MFSRDDTPCIQVDHAVANDFGMDSQPLFLIQKAQQGVRNRADSHLKAVAVSNQLGAVSADGPLHLGNRRDRRGRNLAVGFHEAFDLGDMKLCVAIQAGAFPVDLGNHRSGQPGSHDGIICAEAQADIPLFIGWGDLDEGHVGLHHIAQQIGHLGKMRGRKISIVAFQSLCRSLTDEPRVHAEMSPVDFVGVGLPVGGQHTADFNVFIRLKIGKHRINNGKRRSHKMRVNHAVPASDMGNGLLRAHGAFPIKRFPIHFISPSPVFIMTPGTKVSSLYPLDFQEARKRPCAAFFCRRPDTLQSKDFSFSFIGP